MCPLKPTMREITLWGCWGELYAGHAQFLFLPTTLNVSGERKYFQQGLLSPDSKVFE